MEAVHAEALKNKNDSLDVFERIEATRPLLFNLAEQVLATEPDRWNVIIGDDTGGRLPTHFIHELMKLDGRDMKTFFVATSSQYRIANGPEPYKEYFRYLEEQVGEPLRPLIVTESVSSGATVDFLRDCLEPYSSGEAEVATVAVKKGSLGKVNYAGGAEAQDIKDVVLAYESPQAKASLGRRAMRAAWRQVPTNIQAHIKQQTAHRITPPAQNEMVGIYVDSKGKVPIATVDETRDGAKSTKAFRLMDEMASEVHALLEVKDKVA